MEPKPDDGAAHSSPPAGGFGAAQQRAFGLDGPAPAKESKAWLALALLAVILATKPSSTRAVGCQPGLGSYEIRGRVVNGKLVVGNVVEAR